MRFKFELSANGGTVPILVTTEATATVGDLAGAIESGRTGIRAAERPPLTVEVIDEAGARLLVLPPDSLLLDTPLRSGQRIRLVPGSAAAGPDAEGGARLLVVCGPDSGKSFPLHPGSNILGRSTECDVVLTDREVSRRHARITIDPGARIDDLGSANGITVDGEHIDSADLAGRIPVQAGTTVFVVDTPERSGGPDGPGTAFNRSPHVRVDYEGRELQAPEPPGPPSSGRRISPLMALAPLLMGVVSFLIFRNVMTIFFFAMSPLIMVGTALESKISGKRAHKADVEKFQTALDDLRMSVANALDEEHDRRREEVPALERAIEAAYGRTPLLWYRHPDDDSFLRVTLGYGRAPSRNTLKMPPRRGADEETWSLLLGVEESAGHVDDVPITASLRECDNLGVAGPREERLPVARGYVAQLTCLHSPAELVIAALASQESSAAWTYLTWLPHVDSPYSPIPGPHLAREPRTASALVAQLEEIVASRRDARANLPSIVVLVENDAPVERGRLVSIAEDGPEVGVHLVWMSDAQNQLPAACRAYLVVRGTSATAGFTTQRQTTPIASLELLPQVTATNLALELSPIEDAGAPVLDQSGIPRAVSYLALAGVGLADDPQVTVDRWREDGSLPGAGALSTRGPRTLKALVGQGPLGDFSLDLREQGPHALVGGTSGAGKSEFLQSWVLGMAAAHSPRRVTFLFVDYKGGSAFADCVNLPHCVGLVTDLSPHLVRRALTSFRAELTFREHLLNAKNAKDLLSLEATNDPECPPSLVIVVDEFAALVQEVPEFIDGMIDIAQRGRSLGLHLILATQRPAGVIKGNLRANTALRVALRMADEIDSTDVIDSPLASEFDPRIPGRGAVRTGPGRISLFQTGYAGGRTSDAPTAARIDIETMAFGPGIPWEIPRPATTRDDEDSGPTDITRIVASITNAARACRLPAPRRPWLPELEARFDMDQVLATSGQDDPNALPLGVIDDPAHQSQHTVHYAPDTDGNLAVYGAGGSGKSGVLRALAYAASALSDHARTDIYCLDFSTAGLPMLSPLPNVGAVIDGSDTERVTRLLRRLVELLDDRATRYAAAHADSISEYRRSTGETDEARVLLLVDGLSAFRDAYETGTGAALKAYGNFTRLLAEGRGAGIHVILTADRPGALPSSLAANVRTRLVLRQADENGYMALDVPKNVLVEAPPGRAIFSGGANELQVAIPSGSSSAPSQAAAFVKLAERMRQAGTAPAEGVERLPDLIARSEVPASVGGMPVLGVAEEDLAPLPFSPLGALSIGGMPGSGRTSAIESVVQAVHRWRPSLPLYFIGPRRSRVHDLDLWRASARGVDEAQAVLAPVKEIAENAAADDDAPDVVLVVEALSELVGTPAESALLDVVKKLRRNGHLLIAEQETSGWSSGWPLIAEVRNARHGIVMQPNPMDGDVLFKVDFPRLKRSDYPLGRGVYVHSGKVRVVQLPMPE